MVRQSLERPKVEGVNPYLIFASSRVDVCHKACGQKFFVKVFSDIQVGPSRAGSFVSHRVNSWTLGRCWREQHVGVAQEIETLCRHTIQRLIEMSTYISTTTTKRQKALRIASNHSSSPPPYVYIRSMAIVYKIMTRRPLMMGCRSGNNRARIIWYGPVAEGYLQ